MEKIAAPTLQKDMGMKYKKEVRHFIYQKLNKSIPKYMAIVETYYFLLLEHNKIKEFCEELLHIVNEPIDKLTSADEI